MSIQNLIDNNIAWANNMVEEDPDYFKRLSQQQKPEYLWIGCSDSRVPANQVVGLAPGELFVHRNIANVVVHTDFNCMSVLQFAVEVLKVKHVIVCGHYGCGGVRAAMGENEVGLADAWLTNIRDVYFNNEQKLAELSEHDRVNRLCELNVITQVYNIAKTKVAQHAWDRGQPLSIHGWIYGLEDGLVKDLGVTQRSRQDLNKIYHLFATSADNRPDIPFSPVTY
ncbi:MAG: carbonate dehydratase [Gammaproteobacteria bacterium]|nr:carbonate dehydratase [Gammaproteobacteria bacterium]NVK88132.1 carbonate dehydratase [Gammaproteobacteria bacterium]